MARERTGTLVWRASGWRAFVRVDEDGKGVRKFVDLETTNNSIAKRKLARLVGKVAGGIVEPETAKEEASEWNHPALPEADLVANVRFRRRIARRPPATQPPSPSVLRCW
jgi:hypothetical protein